MRPSTSPVYDNQTTWVQKWETAWDSVWTMAGLFWAMNGDPVAVSEDAGYSGA